MTANPLATGSNSPLPAFVDEESREIEVLAGQRDVASLVAMYDDFASADRAQGLPPVGERRIHEWLDVLRDGIDVVARHADRVVGHATLLECRDGTYELTIFVHPEYQHAGIGSRLVRALLELGRERGVETVWLCVERTNHVAMNLYRSVGFETVDTGIEHEMELRLS